jgi:Flp pilus assembly protein TadG
MRRKQSRRGAAVLETAIVLFLSIIVIFGIFEFARIVMILNVINNAAREGARTAVAGTNILTTQDIQACVTRRLEPQRLLSRKLEGTSIQVYKADPATGANIGTWTDAKEGECIAVEIGVNYKPVVPKFTLVANPKRLTAKVVMYSEAN